MKCMHYWLFCSFSHTKLPWLWLHPCKVPKREIEGLCVGWTPPPSKCRTSWSQSPLAENVETMDFIIIAANTYNTVVYFKEQNYYPSPAEAALMLQTAWMINAELSCSGRGSCCHRNEPKEVLLTSQKKTKKTPSNPNRDFDFKTVPGVWYGMIWQDYFWKWMNHWIVSVLAAFIIRWKTIVVCF